MAIKPILFNTEMVRANLDGRKTVTRRVVKCDAPDVYDSACFCGLWHESYDPATPPESLVEWYVRFRKKRPYQPGDILYVRETWKSVYAYKNYWECGNIVSCEDGYGYRYKADGEIIWLDSFFPLNDELYTTEITDEMFWHPSTQMPKEAARIFLRVTDVRVERLRDMTEEGARAEGFATREEAIQTILSIYPNCTEDSWFFATQFDRISKEEALHEQP